MSLIRPASNLQSPDGQIVRYALTGSFPSISATVALSEAFRGAALAAFHAISETQNSFLLSGHLPNGRYDTEHRHAYYLPKADSDDRIYELLVVSPRDRFSEHELEALMSVKNLRWNGPSARASLELLDTDDHCDIKLASHWISVTPYVPPRRYWGTPGKHHLTPDKQLLAEITAVCVDYKAHDIKLKRWGEVNVRVAPRSTTALGNSRMRRTAFQVELTMRHPVCGPIALGHSSHFGLGLFAPVPSKE